MAPCLSMSTRQWICEAREFYRSLCICTVSMELEMSQYANFTEQNVKGMFFFSRRRFVRRQLDSQPALFNSIEHLFFFLNIDRKYVLCRQL